jgi:hypothetical protein
MYLLAGEYIATHTSGSLTIALRGPLLKPAFLPGTTGNIAGTAVS